LDRLAHLAKNVVHASLDVVLFLLPLLLAFIPAIPRRNRRAFTFFVAGIFLCVTFALFELHHNKLHLWLAPYTGNYVTMHGLVDGTPIHGERPIVLSLLLRLLITSAMAIASLAFFACLFRAKPSGSSPPAPSDPIPWNQLRVLLLPFAVAYFVLLVPRATFSTVFDRYLLVPLMIALIVLLRFYQQRVSPRLPWPTLLFVALFAAYGVAASHDAFAMLRARVALIAELRAAGVSENAIDGGFEYNTEVQIEQQGHLNEPRILIPANSYQRPGKDMKPNPCDPLLFYLFPSIQPRFSLSFDPTVCGGRTAFAPVAYHAWLGPHTVSMYIVPATNPWTR
jgi:hypothetical protein